MITDRPNRNFLASLVSFGLLVAVLIALESVPQFLEKQIVSIFFGEMTLLTGKPRSTTVKAIEETEVFEIGHAAIEKLLRSNPYLADALSRSIAERHRTLSKLHETETEETIEAHRAGVFNSIKRFFRLT